MLLTLQIVVTFLIIHSLLKFAFFFVLPYARRRKMVEDSYGSKPSATKRSDIVLLLLCVVLLVLLFVSVDVDYLSFAVAFYVGMTLIQLYFHQFSVPLSLDKLPPPEVSPIKMMSFAIQEKPSRPWKELLMITVLFLWILYRLASDFGIF
jgi:hypothetical protein